MTWREQEGLWVETFVLEMEPCLFSFLWASELSMFPKSNLKTK